LIKNNIVNQDTQAVIPQGRDRGLFGNRGTIPNLRKKRRRQEGREEDRLCSSSWETIFGSPSVVWLNRKWKLAFKLRDYMGGGFSWTYGGASGWKAYNDGGKFSK
jgi:hypothetical protein